MKNKHRFCQYIAVFLTLTVFLMGCYSKDNLVHHNPHQKRTAGDISNENVNTFLSSIRKIDGDAEAKYRMARHFQQKNRHKIAIEELKGIIHVDPFFVKAYNALGVSYDQLGDYKNAIYFYKLALKIDPNLDYVHNNLGLAYLHYGQYDSAVASFEKAIALNAQNKRFHNNLGYAYAKKKQYKLAIIQFRITGNEYSANYKLGQILYREGNYEMAFQYTEKAHHVKTSAKIMSSVLSSDKEKGSAAALQVEENDGRFGSSDVISDEATSSFKSGEIASTSAMPSLSTNMEKYQVSVDESAELKPVIVRKSIQKRSGSAEKQGQEGEPESKLDLPIKKIDAASTSHPDLSKAQPALAAKNEDLITVVKNEKRQKNDTVIEVQIEVSNGNGVNGMARRLGSYLRKKGFKVTRAENANSFDHEKTKVIYYSGHAQDVSKLLKELPGHYDKWDIIELEHSGNHIKIIIGKDMIPYSSVISSAGSLNNES
jgi:tetratricopeptide (TPR) repeat protein